MNKIKKNIENITNNPNSKQTGIWKVKNCFFPKNQTTSPTAKINIDGQIVTGHAELKKLYLEHFHHRLRFRPIRDDLLWYINEIEKEFNKALEASSYNKYRDWTDNDLEKVLTTLKRSQCADSSGLVNEVFVNGGKDLKKINSNDV